MTTCFICGRHAQHTDSSSGERLCWEHYFGHDAHRLIRSRKATVETEWHRMRAIAAWHADSAYERDQKMAKRLQQVIADGPQ